MKNQTQVCKLKYSNLIYVDELSNPQDDAKFAKVLTFSSKYSTNTLTGILINEQTTKFRSFHEQTLS